MNDKKHLRKEFLKKRENMSGKEAAEKSMSVSENIRSWEIYRKNKSVMSYMPFRNEVDIYGINQEMIKSGKTLYLPKCYNDEKSNNIAAYKIDNLDKDLKTGRFNLKEPYRPESYTINPVLDIIFVPGIVFDKSGGRIGFGAGFYDNFLTFYKGSTHIAGICYDFQLIEEIILDKHDILMDYIITENSIIEI